MVVGRFFHNLLYQEGTSVGWGSWYHIDLMEKLAVFYPTGHELHIQPGHPERPERVEAIRQAFEGAGWWDGFALLEPIELDRQLLGKVHSPGYLSRLEMACSLAAWVDMDTYTTPASWRLALNAAGGAAAVADAVWRGQAQRGFALTRPPGHHATINRGMGFCLLNNIAIASEWLLKGLSSPNSRPRKLAIIDLDLHHGNGTQEIFYNRNDVLYISTHQSPFYPGTGDLNERGGGIGQGWTVNLPLPIYTGDQGYRSLVQEIILPLLDRYQPEMLLISYGYDVHWRDPLGSMLLTATGYGQLIADLVGWADRHCDGKIALFLEGGYDLPAGQACSLAATAALLGEAIEDPLGPPATSEGTGWMGTLKAAKDLFK